MVIKNVDYFFFLFTRWCSQGDVRKLLNFCNTIYNCWMVHFQFHNIVQLAMIEIFWSMMFVLFYLFETFEALIIVVAHRGNNLLSEAINALTNVISWRSYCIATWIFSNKCRKVGGKISEISYSATNVPSFFFRFVLEWNMTSRGSKRDVLQLTDKKRAFSFVRSAYRGRFSVSFFRECLNGQWETSVTSSAENTCSLCRRRDV